MENKLVLRNGTRIEIDGNVTYGLNNIVVLNTTIDKLEEVLTDENLQEVTIITSSNRINGKFTNLELVDLSKNYRTKKITISLQEKATQ